MSGDMIFRSAPDIEWSQPPPWGPLPSAAEVLLARSEVTLCCACINPDQCHRRIVARLLVACGAVDCGERHA